MGRVVRPGEDAVLRAIRVELEPLGFRYKARRLIKDADSMRVVMEIDRWQYAEPGEESIDIRLQFEGCGPTGHVYWLLVHLGAGPADRRDYYCLSSVDGRETVDPEVMIAEFRRYFVPIVRGIDSPEVLAEAILSDEFVANVPNWLSRLDRAIQGYQWADCYGFDSVKDAAVQIFRELAQDPAERQYVEFAWNSIGIPGTPL